MPMSQTLPSLRNSTQNRVESQVTPAQSLASPTWKQTFIQQLTQTAVRDRWRLILWYVAGLHLLSFLLTQWMYDPSRDSDPRLLGVWVVELVAAWGVFRAISGRWGYPLDSAAGVILRIWITFFILVFNSVLMNVQSGWAIHWYRLAWPTLSTFGFATMAWLVNLGFLIPAVWMWVTGLILVRFPHWSYAIYAVSWSIALASMAVALGRIEIELIKKTSTLNAHREHDGP